MATTKTILMTGATSGLGLETLRRLSRQSDFHFIVGARSPERAGHLRSLVSEDRLTILSLDLASLVSVRNFAAEAIAHLNNQPLVALGLNAGIQITTGLEMTEDGYERTFASNYLGHFLLVYLLLPAMEPNSVVVSTASGTHDSQDSLSKQFGFRGGLYPGAEAIAYGRLDESVSTRQQCLDRYATSKLCQVLFTYEMMRRVPIGKTRFIAFDPGLMPGTKLARDRGFLERFAWQYIMPVASWFVPGVSRPNRSAKALAQLLVGSKTLPNTGYFNYQLRPTKTSTDSYRREWQRELYSKSLALTGVANL